MNKPGQQCNDLIEKTASSLSSSVRFMLLAVQKDNLELNIHYAVKWAHSAFERGNGNIETITKLCILAFPTIWDYFYRGEYYSGGEFERGEEGEGRDRESDRGNRRKREVVERRLEEEDERETAERFMRRDVEFREVFSKLNSFVANPPLSTTCDDTHHVLIAITIILEHACLIYASEEISPTIGATLDRAYALYSSSDFHISVRKQFSAPPLQYSTLQYIEFILKHRL